MIYTYNRPKFENSDVYKVDYFNEESPETPLIDEINTQLPNLVDSIVCNGDKIIIEALNELSSSEKTTLDTIIENHI